MLLNSMLANTYTTLRVGSQGACPGSERSAVFRLFNLSSADLKKKIQENLDDLTHACLVKLHFDPALQGELVLSKRFPAF